MPLSNPAHPRHNRTSWLLNQKGVKMPLYCCKMSGSRGRPVPGEGRSGMGLSQCHHPPLMSLQLPWHQGLWCHIHPGATEHINNPQGCTAAPTKGYRET